MFGGSVWRVPLQLGLFFDGFGFFVRRLAFTPILFKVCFFQFNPAELLGHHTALI